ncbi:unknown similar to AMEV090 [Choristoneura rosaceana entomopoxvirus 'L']|uniref:Uncharacterized protein n=1 Tax=Choristoneura rosaceana entomopoxvirus 'L' TaxID=1293539 RepID=A0ABM9QKD9_9POXV|nr:unknown similar to AMEV090 [Choristoneura rosaceana entomopoxvirus 'L']CCU56017.1 unknown similar to AMEV090 [Choristoneura rosaceana entomopoxvirus 'L']
MEYDDDHYIEPIARRKDIYLDFVTAPIEKDIDCSAIKEEDNIYDVIKYFVFKSHNYNNIHIIYDILLNKILLLKYEFKIQEYIIIDNHLIIIYNKNNNIIVDIENKNYIKFKKWKTLILYSTEILKYIRYLKENKKIIKPITNNNIILENNNCNITSNTSNNITCFNIYTNTKIILPEINNNKLIINNKLYELNYNILNIFNFSLIHVLLLTDINNGNIIILNLNNLEQDEYDNYYDIIDMLNDKFYNKIRNSFMV